MTVSGTKYKSQLDYAETYSNLTLMKNYSFANLSVQQLQQAIEIKQQIEALEQKLAQILGAEASVPGSALSKRKRTMSAAGRARIAAAQKARWAKARKSSAPRKPASTKKHNLSPEGRARIIAATKARWAKVRVEKKNAIKR